ncbi:hypothetical protein D3C80_2006720 [compost metagenome]
MLHFRKVAHTAQQTVGDAWRTARTLGHFKGPLIAQFKPHKARAAANDVLQIGDLIELEALHNPEAVAQRRGE